MHKFHSHLWLGLLTALCGCLVSRAAAQSTGAPLQFSAAPPAWATVESAAPATDTQRLEARDGVVQLLSDQQVRVSAATTERYFHHIRHIVAQPGIEHASQLELSFDPTYQRLVIHRITLRRGAQTINALNPRAVRLVQQEDQLEERLFNGTLSALVILDDVRVGDVLAYDYSVNGENSILAGRFTDVNYLIEPAPTVRLRYRLLCPTARPLQHQVRNLTLQPQTRALGDVTEYVWERLDVPAPELPELDNDNQTSEWPALFVSEFRDWQEVVAWALPLYRPPAALSPKLQQHIAAWRASTTDPALRLQAALRFVQDEIRYLGIEMGRHSHEPHAPALVLERRYGDCKDKAFLLATVLKALAIEAWPALVNTETRAQTATLPPSPYAFDHVINVVQLNGQTYWFDPTVALQRGTLAQHYNPEFGAALVIRAGESALQPIPLPPSQTPLKSVRETYTVLANNAATLAVTTVYRGVEADGARAYLAEHTLKDLAKERLDAYTQHDRGMSADGKPQVHDDAEANVITMTERYKIGRFWKEGKRALHADRITQDLPLIGAASERRVRLIYPLDVEQTIELRGAGGANGAPQPVALTHGALAFELQSVQTGDALTLRYRLRALRPEAHAQEAAALAELIERIEDKTAVVLTPASMGGRWLSDKAGVVSLLGLLLAPALAWAAWRWWRARQVRREEFNLPDAVNPLVRHAGRFKHDPAFDAVSAEIEKYRRELDEEENQS